MSVHSPQVQLDPGWLFDLRGRVAIVTGGLGLLGRAFCVALAKACGRVVVVDLDQDSCKRFAAQLTKETGQEAYGIGGDISRPEDVHAMVSQVVDRFSRIDVLVNNAQFKSPHFFAPFEQFPLEDWEKVMHVNMTAVFLCCQAVGKQMLVQDTCSSIVNLTSTYGVVAPDHSIYEGTSLGCPGVYSASKGGVLMLTKYLAAYWGRKRIRVNCIQPHGVFNNQEPRFVNNFSEKSPLGRLSDASEVVGALLYLASDASTYVTGATIAVDGGWTAW